MKLGDQKRLVIGALIAIMVVAVLSASLRRRVSVPPLTKTTDVGGSPSPPPVQSNPGISSVVRSRVVGIPSTEEQRQGEINRLEGTQIVFFGKVVDQDRLPVAGARVAYTVHHLSLAGNSPVEGPVTDKDGRFEIQTQGPSITVSVSHPKFYGGGGAERQVDYGNATTGFVYSPKPTQEHPAVFVLVRKGETETLVQVSSKEIHLPLDGRPAEMSLGEASLKITVRLNSAGATLESNEFRHFDWSLTLAASNGGLIERSDSLDFRAPETGYLPEVVVQMATANDRWSSRINRDYFVHFTNGKYGRFHITVSGETGFCRYESYLNPSGSRNLEVDPAKLVKPSSN
jgi:hypothetical protein